MSLRLRLSLAFVFVVLGPMLIAAFLVARGVPRAADNLETRRAAVAATAAAEVLSQQCALAQQIAASAAWESQSAGSRRAVDDAVTSRPAYVAVVDASGRVRASAGQLPQQVRSSAPLSLGSCSAAQGSSPYVVAAQVPLRTSAGSRRGTVVAALPFDAAMLQALRSAAGGDVTLVAGSRPVASTLTGADATSDAARAPALLQAGKAQRQGSASFAAVPAGAGRPVAVVVRVADVATQDHLDIELAAVIVVALVLAALLGAFLSRMTTRPLVDLASAAQRVAAGDLATQIPVKSHDEVGQLAVSFNEMTDDLRIYIEALRRSRDELRRDLARLGDTLSGTHDLDRILTVILETAMASVRAAGGAVLMGSVGRGELFVKVSRGLPELSPGARVPVGEGVLGSVAASAEPVSGWVGSDGRVGDTNGDEPDARCVIAVPLVSSGRVLGVLGLYDRIDAPGFEETDVETIRSFSAQATVAIENVLLHQEAQRLSITDGLTGLWNYRYFTMNLAKEIERAVRFRRPLALLMLDLDKFKTVNDVHGHQRGDTVLIELATRVSAEIREVDTFARYGGEEFVLILPETDLDGASQAAERVCQVVRRRPFGHEGEEPLHITVSLGVAVFPVDGTTATALVRAADSALYAAKQAGRNGWRRVGDVGVAAGRGDS